MHKLLYEARLERASDAGAAVRRRADAGVRDVVESLPFARCTGKRDVARREVRGRGLEGRRKWSGGGTKLVAHFESMGYLAALARRNGTRRGGEPVLRPERGAHRKAEARSHQDTQGHPC